MAFGQLYITEVLCKRRKSIQYQYRMCECVPTNIIYMSSYCLLLGNQKRQLFTTTVVEKTVPYFRITTFPYHTLVVKADIWFWLMDDKYTIHFMILLSEHLFCRNKSTLNTELGILS